MPSNAESTKSAIKQKKGSYLLLCAYLLFEYGRPQNFIPGLASLHIPMLLQLAIIVRLLTTHCLDFSNNQVKLLVAMVSLMALHIPFAVNNYWAFQMTYATFLYCTAGIGFIFLTRDLDELLRLIHFWTLTFLVLAVVGFVNHGRVPGSPFLGDENDFALAVNFAFPFFLFHMVLPMSSKAKSFYLGAIAVAMLAVVRSMSRGGFVGFIPVAFYCWMKLPRKMLAAIAAVVFLSVIALQVPQAYWDEISTIGQGRDESTADLRVYYWERGWAMFLDNPILGIGPGNFPWRIIEYEPADGHHGRLHGGRPAHSLYFTLLPELGLIGTGLFAAMLWRFIKNRNLLNQICLENNSDLKSESEKRFLHKVKNVVLMMDGGMIAYLVTGSFLSVLYYPYFWTLVCMNAALVLKTKDFLLNSEHAS
jgi:O-antigen ligase